MIELERVSKRFATAAKGGDGWIHALSEVSFGIAGAEFFTLLGPSGCGKTTLLRLIGGFDSPSSGAIRLDGVDVAPLPPHRRPINTVFQSYALFPHLTIAQNIAFGLERLKWSAVEIRDRVDAMLALVRLDGFSDRRPTQLSGGQQQRVAVARALAPRPKVLLLDEPLSALDLKLRKGMQIELKRLQRETGITFVLVTHDQEEALAMSDRIAVMSAGAVMQIGTPSEIYDDPNCRFVADFVGEANLIPGTLLGRSAGCVISVRPETIMVVPDGQARLVGSIEAATFVGPDTLYDVRLDSKTAIRVRLRGDRGAHAVGSTLALGWSDGAERELTQ